MFNFFRIIYYTFIFSTVYISFVLFFYLIGVILFKINKPLNIWPIIDFQTHYYFISGERMIWNGMHGCSKPDPKTIYKPVLGICKNHKNIEYEVSYTFDEYGRNVPNRPKNSQDGIAILGDSVAMGFGVDDYNSFSNQLQILIKDVPIYNLGVESFSTQREIEHYIHSPVFDKTSLVIFTYHQNDLGENITNPSKEEYEKQSVEWAKNKTTVVIKDDLRTKISIYKRIFTFSLNLLPRTIKKIIINEPMPWQNSKLFEKNFEIHYLNFIKIFSNYQNFFQNKKVIFIYINEWAKEFENYKIGQDKNFLNIEFVEIKLDRDDFYIIDDHPNSKGHKSIADQIYKHLSEL